MRLTSFRAYAPSELGVSPILVAQYHDQAPWTDWLGAAPRSLEDLTSSAPDDDEEWTVLTGHQPQWILGPAFVLYKAITVLRLTDLLRGAGRTSVRAAFWSHSDDSDTSEVDHVHVLNPNWDVQRVSLGRPPSSQPLFAQELGERAPAVFAALCEALATGPPDPEILGTFQSHQQGSFATSFGTLANTLLPDLQIVEPRERRDLCAELVLESRAHLAAFHELWRAIDAAIRDRGWSAPFPAREAPWFFLLDEASRRQPVHAREAATSPGIAWWVGEERVPEADLFANVERHPDRVVPGALLRILVQSRWFPRSIYVGGPNELAYHVYACPLAAHLGLHAPRLIPRFSATLLEPEHLELLERFQVDDPLAIREESLRQTHRTTEGFPGARLDRLAERIRATYRELAQDLETLDPSLSRVLPTHAEPLVKQLEKTRGKIERTLANRAGTGGRQAKKLLHTLRPRGDLQERCISTFQLLARHGLGLTPLLREHLDPFDLRHHLLVLSPT